MKLSKEYRRKLHVLLSRMPNEAIKTDKHGRITNWADLSEATKEWIKGHE